MASDCKQNTDPLKLIRVGTRQDQRLADALNPAKQDFPLSDERQSEHALVFTKAYAAFLQFYGPDNTITGTWQPFFSQDESVQLAVAAVELVDDYRAGVKASFDYLKSNSNQGNESELKRQLGFLFSYVGSLARQLDNLKQGLPAETALKAILQNRIQRQLAPAFARLISYYNADSALAETDRLIADAKPGATLLGAATAVFSDIYSHEFSKDWVTDASADWQTFANNQPANASVFGSGVTVFERINHIATHNLFSSVFDQFLKAFARTVAEAKNALAETFKQDHHEPHYALLLAFLRLFDYARAETNTLTQRHLDFYYRDILRLNEKPAEPNQVHVLAELAKQADSHELKAGVLLKAGKDATGVDAFFANDKTFVVNKAKVTALKNLYRHTNPANAPDDSLPFADNRLYAAPVANSDDGLGAKLTSVDQSWQPFFNTIYQEGKLTDINMPEAEIGFAVASHYLLLAEGERIVTLVFKIAGIPAFSANSTDIVCWFTGEDGWFQGVATAFVGSGIGLVLAIKLDGALPAVVPYASKIHGYGFATHLPILRVMLNHRTDADYLYSILEAIRIDEMSINVTVAGIKTLALSNDFGPVDASKPFQPFGALPAKNSSLVIGSKEAFQKKLSTCVVNVVWQNEPAPFEDATVNVNTDFLHKGAWQASGIPAISIKSTSFDLTPGLAGGYPPYTDLPDLTEQQHHTSADRYGFVRLKTASDFGQSAYGLKLDTYISKLIGTITPNPKPIPPAGPFISQLSLNYSAGQAFELSANDPNSFNARPAHFYHITPFGHAEQHGFLKTGAPDPVVYLVPQFKHINDSSKNAFVTTSPSDHAIRHEAECYIGLTDLKPPQNLALLFQVADGTADPLSQKPEPHIHWSYLSANEWLPFAEYTIEDTTSEWLNSGIITLAVPDDATSDNTLMPTGQHWLKAAVAKESDAVCRLQQVAAQGFTATFQDQGNDPSFNATPVPAGAISKLDQPDAAVKAISQPFPSFGGRGAEQPNAFYTRISERLRHKDRGITLWDYERLLLQAFPQIYQAKCLNHTHYEPDTGGGFGIYRELAPGHVTVVAIPNQAQHNLRDPLRPYASLGLINEIEALLKHRLSCVVTLHVENPLFEEVGISCSVRFHEGFDETFYANQLNEAITRFLSPWAFPGGGNPSFGGKIYRSVLLNFVEEQAYVDYVTDFKLSHRYQRFEDSGASTEVFIADASDLQGSKALSLLVSARKHSINVINVASDSTAATCPCAAV